MHRTRTEFISVVMKDLTTSNSQPRLWFSELCVVDFQRYLSYALRTRELAEPSERARELAPLLFHLLEPHLVWCVTQIGVYLARLERE